MKRSYKGNALCREALRDVKPNLCGRMAPELCGFRVAGQSSATSMLFHGSCIGLEAVKEHEQPR